MFVVEVDLSLLESVKSAAATILKTFGQPHALVNNAGDSIPLYFSLREKRLLSVCVCP